MMDINSQGEEPYVVTRGKPPREYQFKKGQSGNPRGRPKGSKQIGALLEEELDRKLEVTVHGRRTKLSKRQVMVKQLVERALKGDHKAIATCLAMQAKDGSAGGRASSLAEEFDTQVSKDELALMGFLSRQAPASPEGGDGAQPTEGGDHE